MLELLGLSYSGAEYPGLEDLTFAVGPGEVFGLLGPLEAGLGTLPRLLATLLRPTAGDALIGGHRLSANPEAVRASLGFVPQFSGAYEDMRAGEYLEFFALAYGVGHTTVPHRTRYLLELVGLAERRNDLLRTLNREEKWRLRLARTLVHDPPVVVLDRPMNGLAPSARRGLGELIGQLGELGKAVLLISNILSDVQGVCRRVGLLQRGRLTAQGEAEDIIRRHCPQRLIEVQLAEPAAGSEAAETLCTLAATLPHVSLPQLEKRSLTFFLSWEAPGVGATVEELVRLGLAVSAFREHEVNPEFYAAQVAEETGHGSGVTGHG